MIKKEILNTSTSFSLRMFCDPDAPKSEYPDLKKAVKAAHVRSLVPIINKLAHEYDNKTPKTDHDRKRRLCTSALAHFYEVVDSCEIRPTRAQSNTLLECANAFLVSYSQLASDAMESGRKVWSVVNKFHFFYHLAQQCVWCDPKLFWTFQFEDFVGRISKVGHSCLPGTSVLKVSSRIADKVCVAKHIQISRGLINLC